MRLIDEDKLLEKYPDCRGLREKLKEAPTIDAVPVVRCKDCRYNYDSSLNHGEMHPKCDFTDRVLNGNDYCSRGERKDGAG